MQLPAFNEYRELFYKLNVKEIPENIYELLTPRGLAFLHPPQKGFVIVTVKFTLFNIFSIY
jgi:hypothetical protein